MTSWVVLLPIVIGGAAVAVMVLWAFTPGGRRRLSRTWIRQQGAPVTVELTREIEDERWRRQLGALLGLLIGLAAVIPVIRQFDPTEDQNLVPYLAIFAIPYVLIVVGRSVGGLIGAIREARGPVRVAPVWQPRLTDYVSPAGLVAVRISTPAIAGVAIAAIRLPSWAGWGFGPDQSGYAWSVLVAVVLIWAAVEMVARYLVAQPQPSGDALTWFWRQALRGERLRELYLLLSGLGFMFPLLVSFSITRPVAGEHLVKISVSTMAMAALLLSLVAQMLLLKVPSSAHGRQALQAARRAYETV